MSDAPKKSFADRLQSVNKTTLFLILILCTSVPLWFNMTVPNDPEQSTIDLFKVAMAVPEGSTVLMESDWTNSTRGESGGQFKAIMRILMRKKVKICMYTAADPQAPKVAKDAIRSLNVERVKNHEAPYREWEDWVHAGYFPSAEGTSVSIASNIRPNFFREKREGA